MIIDHFLNPNWPNLDDPGEIQFEDNTETSTSPTLLPDNAQVDTTVSTLGNHVNVNNQCIRKPLLTK